MGGAGRGVTPGANSGESAASPGPGPGQPASGSGTPAPAAGETKADASSAGAGSAEAPEDNGASAGDQPGSPSGGRRAAGRRPRKKRSFWREFPVLVVVALLLAVIIKTYAIQAFFIPSGSMENTLKINDRVLVNKIVYHTRGIHRGDIVVFNGDGSWDPGTVPASTNFVVQFADGFASMFGFGHPGDILIKRVIGLPGDHVACCDTHGRVTVNGVPLDEGSYLYPGNVPSELKFSIVVPSGRLWVMGDHRQISDDSREHQGSPGDGTIPESAVIGRAFVIIWPPSRWRVLPIPDTFQQPELNAAAAAAGAPAARDAASLLSARLEPSSPALPLTLGFAAAVPVTWLQRRLRLRVSRRRAARRRPGQQRTPGPGELPGARPVAVSA